MSGGTLYLYSERSTVKARNLAADPRVVVHLESGEDVLIVRGTAEDVGAPAAVPAVVAALDREVRPAAGPGSTCLLLTRTSMSSTRSGRGPPWPGGWTTTAAAATLARVSPRLQGGRAAAQAAAVTSKGPSGSRSRQCSRSGDAVVAGQGGDVGAGRADPERERFPPVVERCVGRLDGEQRVPHGAEAGLGEQLGQVAFPDPGPARLVLCRGVEVAGRPPEQRQRAAAASEVPDARRHRPARARHPAHLAQARDRIGHEVHHQLGQHHLERAVRERQLLRRGPPDVHARQPLPDGGGERRRRVDRADQGGALRRTSSAVSAPGPQPTSSTRWPGLSPARSANGTASGSENLPMNRR